MEKVSLKELALPLIKSIDSFNYLLKSHHRRTAVISYYIASKMGLSRDDLTDLIVAASMHDIGALSVQERDMLIKEDVLDPEPHCIMGYRMLSNFVIFDEIARIIRHHHIRYEDRDKHDNVKFQSFILHLADRVDILINRDKFILNQKADVTGTILAKCGTVFHPDVCEAFKEVSHADIFWIDINNLTMEQLFERINFMSSFELSREQIIQFALTISRIIDFRSSFTASHSYVVGQVASLIGRAVGLDDETQTKLMIAGYLHDIGKIGIDTQYLEKAGALTDEEYNIVKLHSYYSGQILCELNSSPWFRDIVNWSKYHHEKLSGQGYPFSLKGQEIDSCTRIIAYSDVIAALMEDRPYRKKLSADDTFAVIENQFAADIDPDMIGKIKECRLEIEALVSHCREDAEKIYHQAVQ